MNNRFAMNSVHQLHAWRCNDLWKFAFLFVCKAKDVGAVLDFELQVNRPKLGRRIDSM